MQRLVLSLADALEAMNLDAGYRPLLEQTPIGDELINADSPEKVLRVFHAIGEILHLQEDTQPFVEGLEERINIVIHKLKFIPEESKPKVLVLGDNLTPRYDAYLTNLIHIAGGIAYTEASDLSFPTICIIRTEKPISQLLNELPTALLSTPWSQSAAVTDNRVYIVHNPIYLRQPSVHVADDLEILAEIIQPKYFIFGRDADVWMKFDWQ